MVLKSQIYLLILLSIFPAQKTDWPIQKQLSFLMNLKLHHTMRVWPNPTVWTSEQSCPTELKVKGVLVQLTQWAAAFELRKNDFTSSERAGVTVHSCCFHICRVSTESGQIETNCFDLLTWKKNCRLDCLTYIFIIFYSRVIRSYLYRAKYYSACIWPG